MDNKNKYFRALKKSNGRLGEMDLGELLGFKDDLTRHNIAQLVSEYRIQYYENGYCNYRVMKGFRGKNRKLNLR